MPAMFAALPALLGKIGLGAGAKAAAGGAAKAGLMGGAKRMAGNALTSYLGGKPTVGNLAMNFGMDGAFGVMAGMNAPGDIGDKLITGLTVGGAGALGGVGATAGLGMLRGGKMPTGGMRMVTEFGGAMLGDEVGFGASDALLRMKGGGTTPYEKQAASADQQYKAQIEQEMMRKYGIYPGIPTYNSHDPFMSSNGIG